MKTAVITIRVTKEVKRSLKEKAKARELSLSNFLIMHALKNKDLTIKERKQLTELVFQIQKIGINLNQITKRLNISTENLRLQDIKNVIHELKLQNQQVINFINDLL